MIEKWIAAALIAGCGGPPPPALGNTAPRNTAPRSTDPLPCGVEIRAELSPFEPARCEPGGSCWPGAPRTTVGSCSVTASSAFDRFRGDRRLTVTDDGRPVLSSDATPYARTVVFDPRIPVPEGARVGMTGWDLERELSELSKIACGTEDPGWPDHLRCELRRTHHPECDEPDGEALLLVFDRGTESSVTVKGPAARALIRTRTIRAIDLGPDCGGWD